VQVRGYAYRALLAPSRLFREQRGSPMVHVTGTNGSRHRHGIQSVQMGRERITRRARWFAWRGDKDALRRLSRSIQTFADQRLEAELEAIASTDQAEEISEVEQAYARAQWRVIATAREAEFDRTRRDVPDEVIEAMDEGSAVSFVLDLLAPGLAVEVGLHKSVGCFVRLYGSETQQIHSLFPEVASAVKRGVPRWHWLRSRSTSFCVRKLHMGVRDACYLSIHQQHRAECDLCQPTLILNHVRLLRWLCPWSIRAGGAGPQVATGLRSNRPGR
jgi:hypothetical protein